MPRVSLFWLSKHTGKTRENIGKWIDGLDKKKGPGNSWTFDSADALSRIYLRRTDSEQASNTEDANAYIDQQEANRLLAVLRGEEIKLGMEVTSKKRIPLELCEEVNDRAFSNVAGMLKSNEGKMLTGESINDMLTELRTVSEAISKWSR